MHQYQIALENGKGVRRLTDSAFIPIEPTNPDYQEYLDWLAQGNEPLPYEPQPVPELPNWPGFVGAIQGDADFKSVWGAANAVDPLVTQSLLVAFGHVATGGLETFAPLYNAVCGLGGATLAQRNAWATLAETHYCPAEFVSVVRGGD